MIPHEHLKELYTGVVDELLDIQLEFEEKLTDAEEQSKDDLEKLRQEMEDQHKGDVNELNRDLERHKEAISKLNDKLITTSKNLATARA